MINLQQHSSLLIYCQEPSPRLQYICQFIFTEQLGVEFVLTHHREFFVDYEGPKISYFNERVTARDFWLLPHELLFEQNIKPQQTEVHDGADYPRFFLRPHGDFSFDIFAASFYLLSRYEEYLPHEKDMYGRYAHENSLAHRNNFLHLPVIHFWIDDLAKTLQKKFPELHYHRPPFSFLPTYDIDMAYSYKGKGLVRNMGGFIKSPSAERLAVLAMLKQDPYDCYAWLDDLHDNYQLTPIYFFLVGTRPGTYDKNLSPYGFHMWRLMKKISRKYSVGLHPSWFSFQNKKRLLQEKKIVETVANRPVSASRQHYIRFNLPEGYQLLSEAGITDDYSMGYGSINGFRASVAAPFYWFNPRSNEQTLLRIHPFCYMEANSFYEQRQTAEGSLAELEHYYRICKAVQGNMISIFHNNFLGTAKPYRGWREMYSSFIAQAQ